MIVKALNQNQLIVLFCIFFALGNSGICAAEMRTNAFLIIQVKELHSEIQNDDQKDHRLLRWTLVISNATPRSIRVSRFSLDGFLNRTKLFDTKTNILHLIKDDMVRDPPPPSVDFSILIPGKKSVQVESYTEDIEALPAGGKRPELLCYSVDGEVDIRKGSSAPVFVNCHSEGEAPWKP